MPSRLSTDPIRRPWSQRLLPAVEFSQISGRSFQRLTAADLDGRGAQPSQVVHVLAHSSVPWRGVRVVRVTRAPFLFPLAEEGFGASTAGRSRHGS